MKVTPIKSLAITVIIAGIIIPSAVSAQTDSLKPRAVKNDNYALSIDLTTPFASFNPQYKVGVYFPREKNIEYSIQFGFGHEAITPYIPFKKLLNPPNDELEKYKFVELCPQIRFYSAFEKTLYMAYLFQLQYKEQHYYDGGYIRTAISDPQNISYIQADYKSVRLGINSIAGWAPRFKNKVGFDLYLGFGVRMLFNRHSNVEEGGSEVTGTYRYKTNWDGIRLGYIIIGGLNFIYIL
jgi:hypothetical protein